jgi:hypothetical protein
MGRTGKAEEIANVALWLCSDRASYANGAVFAADGGFLARLFFASLVPGSGADAPLYLREAHD